MAFTILVLVALALVLLVGNALTTWHVWRDPRRTHRERVAETGLIWLVPAFGLLVSLAISLDGADTVRRADPVPTGAAVGHISSLGS